MIKIWSPLQREEYKNSDRFRSTNGIWNKLGINRAFVIGYTMNLIDGTTSYDEWCIKYLNSGAERRNLMASLNSNQYNSNENFANYIENQKAPADAIWDLNTKYGRTIEELEYIGRVFQYYANIEGYDLTEEEAYNTLIIRLFDETWKGYGKELDVINNIINKLNVQMVHSSVDMDSKYAIDGIVSFQNRNICAIQIKPVSYLGNAAYLAKAHIQNEEKNRKFTEEYGIPVVYTYYDDEHVMTNEAEILNFICDTYKERYIA